MNYRRTSNLAGGAGKQTVLDEVKEPTRSRQGGLCQLRSSRVESSPSLAVKDATELPGV